MRTVKVRIFEKNEGFVNDLIDFLMNQPSEFSKTIRRDNFINEVLSINEELKKHEILRDLSPIRIGTIENSFDACGKNYESTKEGLSISKITHILHNIIVESRNDFYGTIKILDTPNGKTYSTLDKNDIILMPIYNRENKIVRFDIDIDINKAA